MPARVRYKGSLDDLHAAIAPFAVSPGWFVYEENESDKVNPELLVAHKVFLRSLTHTCENLSFNKAQLKKVFQRLVVEKQFSELSTSTLQAHWVKTMGRRVRAACRHLAQARIRKQPPQWLAHIDAGAMSQLSSFAGDGHPDEDGEGEEEEEEKERDEEEDEEGKDVRAQDSHRDAQGPDSCQDAQGPEAEVFTFIL